MSTQVQFRRGTTTQNNAFTGAAGEISVDTDLKTIRLHDGTTAGGGSTMLNNISTQTALNKTFSTGSVWQGSAVGLAYGGTGSAITAVAGAVAYSTANGLGLSAAGTSGQILVSGGVNAPTWVPTSSISAGTSTLAATATNIAGGSAGQLIIQADTGLSTFITAGPSGTFLRSAGAGYAPTWATADVTIGSTVISLGSSSTSLAGLNILDATGTSHWTLPVGTTAQRPASPAVGMVRYNSTQSTFEGYSSGAWSSLGGVKSVDGFTYIIAETSAGASNGELEFYVENAAGTGTTKAGGWTQAALTVNNNLIVSGNSTFTGTINRNPVITLAGDLSGSVTLTDLQNGTLTATIVANAVALGTDTTGDYVAGVTAGTGVIVSGSAGEGWSPTIAVDATSANTANKIVQRDGSGNFSAGTITASVFQTSSDLRLKSNIENSSYGLTEVLQLRSVKYIKNNKVEVGLIAQEVEQILPEFVGQSEDGMKTVNYGQMVSVLVKAVQDLQAEVASLKSKLGE